MQVANTKLNVFLFKFDSKKQTALESSKRTCFCFRCLHHHASLAEAALFAQRNVLQFYCPVDEVLGNVFSNIYIETRWHDCTWITFLLIYICISGCAQFWRAQSYDAKV